MKILAETVGETEFQDTLEWKFLKKKSSAGFKKKCN